MSMRPSDKADVRSTAGAYTPEQLANIIAAVHDPRHLQQIGPYHIQDLIGEGGMGSVYRAEQREPIRRIVAIKIIKLGMDTRQVIARFESERQALALMDHPNVAKVLDAGATDNGRPFFVMEYVDGEPITSFCDAQQYTVRQRLELFQQACEAVQHAHQKAIIHRDLKPSNILVTLQDGKPWVKVIDFGVAKAISQRLTEKSLFTETGQLLGTPEYMAPEQAEGNALDVDTRTDVYSLGVVLYELLIGTLPFDPITLRSGGYNEIQRIIREVDPPRPSTKLSSLGKSAQEIARMRQTQLEVLHQQLSRELEWIPLKAMRKERDQRYSSAREISEDIANYLEQRPLRAGPESRTYRARKFLRRNKAGVAALAAMLLVLLCGIVATSWQAIRATRAERQALAQKAEAEAANANSRAVIDFFTDNVVGAASPVIARGRELTVEQALDEAAESINGLLNERPLIQAAIRHALGHTYSALGRSDLARQQMERAIETRSRLLGDEHPDTLRCKQELILILSELGQRDQAWQMASTTLAQSRRALGNDHPVTIMITFAAGRTAVACGKPEQAEALLREVIDRGERVLKESDSRTLLGAISNLSNLRWTQGKFAEAEDLSREAVKRARTAVGSDDPLTLRMANTFGAVLVARGKLSEAESVYREALQGMRRVLGENHITTILGESNLAVVLHKLGRLDEAEAIDRDVLERHRRVLGNDHPDTLIAINNLAVMLQLRGKLADAETLLREALQTARNKSGNDHPNSIGFARNLAFVLAKQKKYDEAETLYRDVMERSGRILGASHPDTLNALDGFANMLKDSGKTDRALPLFEELYSQVSQAELDPREAAKYTAAYALCLYDLGRTEQANAALEEAYERLKAAGFDKQPIMSKVVSALADVCDHANRPADAEKWRAQLAAFTIPPSTQPTSKLAQPSLTQQNR